MNNLTKIIQNIHNITEDRYDERMDEKYHNNLDDLVTGVNNIMQKIQEVVSEESHIEQTKTELITNLSQDLRKPLTSMIDYLSWLSKISTVMKLN